MRADYNFVMALHDRNGRITLSAAHELRTLGVASSSSCSSRGVHA
jgi:hypothetical protein